MIKGKPETEEVIPFEVLKKSVNKAAWAYTDKHLGPKEVSGNKGAYVVGCSYVGSFFSLDGKSRKAA